MPLACFCDFENYEWFYYPPKDFSKQLSTQNRTCRSCGTTIYIGMDCLKFERMEDDEDGNEIELSPYYHCEECGGLYFALQELGFCIDIDDRMKDLVKEYNDDYA